MLHQKDARGITTAWTYDELDRTKTEQPNPPDGDITTWNYDEKGHGDSVGMLTSVSDPTAGSCPSGLADSFTYDLKNGVVKHIKCALGVTHNLTFSDDQVGRLASITYPPDNPAKPSTNEIITYRYDLAGRLYSVSSYV